MKKTFQGTKKEIAIYSIICASLVSFSFFCFEPINIYLTNINEFWFSFSLMLPLVIGVSAVVWGLLVALLLLLAKVNNRFWWKTVVGINWLSIGLFIQGFFVPDSNGVLDGTEIDWTKINSEMIMSYVLWILVIGCCVICIRWSESKKVFSAVKISTGFILTIETITLIILAILSINSVNKNYYTATYNGAFEYSDKNFIIFILDDFDSNALQDRLDEVTQNSLEDFTFFPDTMSVYGHTDLSLPQILTGEKYYNEQMYYNYLEDAYSNSTFISYLNDNNWDIGLYTTNILPASIAEKTCNCTNVPVSFSSKRSFIKYYYGLVAYRFVPYPLKKYFWGTTEELIYLQDFEEQNYEVYNWLESSFNDKMSLNIGSRENASFKMYHLKGMHEPFHTTAKLEESNGTVSADEIFTGNIELIRRYIEQLKNLGEYDNTVIMIMSDHGESRRGDGEWKQNPLFLIKGFNERHDFVVSEQRISYDDLQDIYMNLINEKFAKDATNILDGGSERIFLRYNYEREATRQGYFPTIREYISDKDASDIDGFVLTGREYSFSMND